LEAWWLASYVVLWLLVAVLCATVVALARQIGTLHLRLGPRGALELDDEGPALGGALEPVQASDTLGRPLTIAAPGEPQMLLFVSPECPVCEQVLPSVAAIRGAGDLTPYVLVDADLESSRLVEGGRTSAPVVPAAELASRLDVPGTPYVLVLDEDGIVRAKGTVNNLEQIEGLTRTARGRLEDVRQKAAA
jgi:methylamine dehydrogenase accessory protein MauD